MSKKTVLKWICVTATICSLHAGIVTVAAEDVATTPSLTDNTTLLDETVPSTDVTTPAEEVVSSVETNTTIETEAQPSSADEEVTDVETDTGESETVALASEYSTDFDSYDEATMAKADWWNGNPFGAVWKPDKVAVENGVMTLTIDKGTDTSAPVEYISGELRTQEFFHYGTYEVSMKPIKNPGTVSSFFTYTGPSDNNPWDEVDIEFLGKDTTKVQFNYYTNGKGEHEYVHELGFDASESFHTYAFDWQKDYITWYVDGKAVYTATENIPVTPGRIMMNAWPGKGVDEWLQPYEGQTPLVASYDRFSYKATEPVKENVPPISETPDSQPPVAPSTNEDNLVPNTKPTVPVENIPLVKLSGAGTVSNTDRTTEVQSIKRTEEPVVEEVIHTGFVTQKSTILPKTGTQEGVLATLLGFVSLLTSFILVPLRKKNN